MKVKNKEEHTLKNETTTEKKEITTEGLNDIAGGQSLMDEIYDTAAFTLKLMQSKKVDRATVEEIIRKLRNNEITPEEVMAKYL